MDRVEELAAQVRDIWVRNLTLSGALAFAENERKREALFAKAEALGIRDEVYRRATEMMSGNA